MHNPRIEAAALEAAADTLAACWHESSNPLDDARATISAYLAAADKAATITTVEELDALPQGTLVSCENVNPAWPDVFLHTGGKRDPWLALDPSDRDDGERTLDSGTVLRWHGKGEARVIRWGSDV